VGTHKDSIYEAGTDQWEAELLEGLVKNSCSKAPIRNLVGIKLFETQAE
jgi:hypothetical protein